MLRPNVSTCSCRFFHQWHIKIVDSYHRLHVTAVLHIVVFKSGQYLKERSIYLHMYACSFHSNFKGNHLPNFQWNRMHLSFIFMSDKTLLCNNCIGFGNKLFHAFMRTFKPQLYIIRFFTSCQFFFLSAAQSFFLVMFLILFFFFCIFSSFCMHFGFYFVSNPWHRVIYSILCLS